MKINQIEKAVTLQDCADYARSLSTRANLLIATELKKHGLNYGNYVGVQTGICVNANSEVHREFLNALKQTQNIIADTCFLLVENIVLSERLRKLNPPQITEIAVIAD